MDLGDQSAAADPDMGTGQAPTLDEAKAAFRETGKRFYLPVRYLALALSHAAPEPAGREFHLRSAGFSCIGTFAAGGGQ